MKPSGMRRIYTDLVFLRAVIQRKGLNSPVISKTQNSCRIYTYCYFSASVAEVSQPETDGFILNPDFREIRAQQSSSLAIENQMGYNYV